jgi:phage major head subunit gpT-like protein
MMGAERLSSRAISGAFFQALEAGRAESWLPSVSEKVISTQSAENYPFISSAPIFREFIGGRQVQGFVEHEFSIANRHFESTIELKASEIRRDKTQQIKTRIADLARSAAQHPHRLISSLINSGASSLCYDGQYFFDTDHPQGNSDAQSNIVDVDITTTGVPLAQQGLVTAPSAWTLACAIATAVSRFFTLKDDRGEPMNSGAKKFLVMLPNNFLAAQMQLGVAKFAFDIPNPLAALKYEFDFHVNPRLVADDAFTIFRTDGTVKPFIWQVETEIAFKSKGEDSEYAFDNAAVQFGVDQWCNAAYGYYQEAILCRLL